MCNFLPIRRSYSCLVRTIPVILWFWLLSLRELFFPYYLYYQGIVGSHRNYWVLCNYLIFGHVTKLLGFLMDSFRFSGHIIISKQL